MSYRPLADEIRPQSLDEVVGQRHILGENGLLRRIIESGHIPNLVFYGPSGTGKTTVANIIARRTNRPLHRLNATTASISDIKDIIKDIGTMLAPDGVLLYLDEIQYFNKKQQQSLLEFMENGKITLIASTTENPYFYVYNAVLSRSTVFEFKPIEAADVLPAIDRGIRLMGERLGAEVDCEDGVREHIATACGGDVRKSMNAVELLLSSARREGERLVVTLADAQTVAQRSAMRYDREGDDHYDIASALMKSMRGSDPDAALHYLARLLEAGDMLTAIRIAREFDLDYVLVHGTEGHLIADILAAEGARVICGPLLTDRSKPELSHQTIENPARLARAGIPLAICTDHPELPIQYLPLSAAMAVRAGLDKTAALRAITIDAARLAGVADRVGSLEAGKDADVVLCSAHPFSMDCTIQAVFIDGKQTGV